MAIYEALGLVPRLRARLRRSPEACALGQDGVNRQIESCDKRMPGHSEREEQMA